MPNSEQDFLKTYDRNAFTGPLVTIDAVIFTFSNDELQLLLTKRSEHPEINKWALPGGFVDKDQDNTLEDTVQRKLLEKTGVTAPYIEQLMCIGNNERDIRDWSVTVVYSALIAQQACKSYVDNVSDVAWVNYETAMEWDLAFDHKRILEVARARLKQKALYSIVPVYALPKEFSLPELQRLHEVLIDKPLQKKSFRRRIEQADLLEEIGQRAPQGKGRPSTIYSVKKDAQHHRFTRNLEQ